MRFMPSGCYGHYVTEINWEMSFNVVLQCFENNDVYRLSFIEFKLCYSFAHSFIQIHEIYFENGK